MKTDAQIVGVLGGMGPRASSEFLRTIYEFSCYSHEQEAPRVILISDPTYPDRTEALLQGKSDLLLERLAADLAKLGQAGSRSIIICCFTIHYLLPQMPERLRSQVVSLVDVALERTIAANRRQLLLCSTGTRKLGILERHPLWPPAADLIVVPDRRDQDSIHDLIYRLKRSDCTDQMIREVDTLLARYHVDSFLAGCTEIHLLIREADRRGFFQGERFYLDPLVILAEAIARGTLQPPLETS